MGTEDIFSGIRSPCGTDSNPVRSDIDPSRIVKLPEPLHGGFKEPPIISKSFDETQSVKNIDLFVFFDEAG